MVTGTPETPVPSLRPSVVSVVSRVTGPVASRSKVPALMSTSRLLISTSVEDALPTVMVRPVALVPILMAPVSSSVPMPMVPPLESMATLPAGFRSMLFVPVTVKSPSVVSMVTWSRVVAPSTSRVLSKVTAPVTASVLSSVVAPVTSRVPPISTLPESSMVTALF